jgi:hypothetical protein
VMDFFTDTYQSYVDNSLLASVGFPGRVPGSNELVEFSFADITTFGFGPEGSTSFGLSASAVFDNFIVQDGLLGDYNLDGTVNAADYTTWKSTFGSAISPSGNNADGNKNGIVDAADYVIWRDNQGATLGSGAGLGAALSTTVVPEPAGVVVVFMAAPAFLYRLRRRRVD